MKPTTSRPAGRIATALRAGLLAAGLALGAAPAWAQNIPGTAARVNGVEITNFRLERHFEEFLKGQRRNISSMINPRVYKKLKREALEQLIEREVLWQAAQAEAIVAADDEVQAALAQMGAQGRTRDAYLRRLEHAGFTEATHAEYVRRELSGTKFLMRKAAEPPPVSDDDVAAFYRANLHQFQQPGGVRARHILVKVAANAGAEEHAAARARLGAVRAEALAGGDFAELARRHSADSSAAEGGDLGPVPRGRMVQPFEDALYALAEGQVSGIVQTNAGYHLIRHEGVVATVTQPLEEVREAIRARLLAQKRAGLAREIVARLKAAAHIEVLARLD